MPVPVVCAIIFREGRVLLAQRPEGKHLARCWEFPGGKIESAESPEAALHRELDEELGCTVEVLATLPACEHDYGRAIIVLQPFVCQLTATSPEPEAREHAALQWVAVADCDGWDLAPADIPVLAHLRAMIQALV
jgi:8-oxo-dGTP diphosphatase